MKTRVNQQQTRIPSVTTAVWMAAASLFLACAMVSVPPASAQTVTGGTLTIVNDSAATFILSGTGPGTSDTFTMNGSTYVPGGNSGLLCFPCSSPLPIFFGASGLDFASPGNGTVLIGGVSTTYPTIAWSDFNLQGGPTYLFINGPPITVTGPGTYTSPVSYQLALCGLTNFVAPPHCDVTLPVKSYPLGSAYVVLTIVLDVNTGYLQGTAAKFFF